MLGRNHRKLIVIDRRTVFVSGLCISSSWEGRPERGQEPWRDTGVKFSGPLAADALAAFADSWASCGSPLPAEWLTPPPAENCGGVAARLIATTPATAQMMRLDLLIACFARRTLWLTDAYFMGTSMYLTALNRPRATASMSACWCRVPATSAGSPLYRAPNTARCLKPAFAFSNGTAR
ncbi:hypothetical protein JOS77_07665 [Chromobacterium haemolyticum]|nr:hypothetical protein JOS77_07665 [Chromobacterium haemolyticum]